LIKKLGTKALQNDLGIHLEVPQDLPRIFADENMIKRVLVNLVENAICYSPNGGEITLSARTESPSRVVVTVSDTGAGIPENEIPLVFGRLFRGGQSSDQVKSGSGLGLAICRQILELHGQEIWVESKLGIGSAFSFSLDASGERSAEP